MGTILEILTENYNGVLTDETGLVTSITDGGSCN